MAYRIEIKAYEILVTGDKEFEVVVVQKNEKLITLKRYVNKYKNMKIIPNLLKDSRDEWLVYTTAAINKVNPIIDRIMDDDSVVVVVMTNKEGNPILTNISLNTASNFAKALYPISKMARRSITELDIFDEALTFRVNTKNYEILLVPHLEFNIVVVQQKRIYTKKNPNKSATSTET